MASNVADCETQFITSFVKFANEGSDALFAGIAGLSDKQRPKLLQGLTPQQIVQDVATPLRDSISSALGVAPEELHFTASRNNREGSDLEETVSGVSIELKLGKATDVNAGFGAVVSHLFPEYEDVFPSNEDRKRWRVGHVQGRGDAAIVAYQTKIADAAYMLSDALTGKLVGPDGVRLLEGYHAGITNAQEIDRGVEPREIIRFDLLASPEGLVWSQKLRTKSTGVWRFDSFEFTDKKRFRFAVSAEGGSASLEMVLNQKNSYRIPLPDGTKLKTSPLCGLGSPSFNGWWRNRS